MKNYNRSHTNIGFLAYNIKHIKEAWVGHLECPLCKLQTLYKAYGAANLHKVHIFMAAVASIVHPSIESCLIFLIKVCLSTFNKTNDQLKVDDWP